MKKLGIRWTSITALLVVIGTGAYFARKLTATKATITTKPITPAIAGTLVPGCTKPVKAHESALISKCLLGNRIDAPSGENLRPLVYGKTNQEPTVFENTIKSKSQLPTLAVLPLREETLLNNRNRYRVLTDSVLDGKKMLLIPQPDFDSDALKRRSVQLSQIPVISGFWEQKRIEEMLLADGFTVKELVSETVAPLDAGWETYSVVKLYRGVLDGKDLYAALAMSPMNPESFRLVYAKGDDHFVAKLREPNATLKPVAYQAAYLTWERRDKAKPGIMVSTQDVSRSELGLVAGQTTDPQKFQQTEASICLAVEADAISKEKGTFCSTVLLDTSPNSGI
jgi:hypothetical protein